MQSTTRIEVRVTFLRTDTRNPAPRPLPPDVDLVRVEHCSVAFYRYLYGTIGAPYMWWLRRSISDEALSGLLLNKVIAIYVLYRGGQPAGYFELDTTLPTVNLSYFGLMPETTGLGLGVAFLDAALETAWNSGARAITVNTCTADHPRALPNYLRAGFQRLRAVDEAWDIPDRLGLVIPAHLRG